MKTLILTPVGNPRSGLRTFLQFIPGLELLEGTECPSAELLIFDIHTPEYSDWAEVRRAKARVSATHCIAIVSVPRQMADALAAGADRALMAGFSAAEFMTVLATYHETPEEPP